MSSKTYPRQMPAIKCEARNRPYFVGKPCQGGCGKLFAKKDQICIVEVQTSWMRGDDEVYAYCPECHEKLSS